MENKKGISIVKIELNLSDMVKLTSMNNAGLTYSLVNENEKVFAIPLNIYTCLLLLGIEVNYADVFAVSEYVIPKEIENYGRYKLIQEEIGFKLCQVKDNGEINDT